MMTTEAQPAAARPRIDSIDFLRGLVIVLMALDHVRDYTTNIRFDPLDADQTNAILYFTRWITHYCAPTFVFLAGVSAGLQNQKGKSKAKLSSFLVTRGLWLVFLELTVILFGWKFNFTPILFLQVIWVIGVSMIVLAALIHLPLWAIAAFAVVLIFGHNLFDGIRIPFDFNAPTGDPQHILWAFLHQLTPLQIGPFFTFLAYPLIPWVGVMALGYVFAELYRRPEKERRSLLLRIGLGAVAAFLVVRGINIYGDPQPWTERDTLVKTAMAFLNVNKYPPSLAFVLMTLGPALVILSFAERWKGPVYNFFVMFGRVPLFFYILHIYLAHLAAVALAVSQGYPASSLMVFFFFFPPEYGVGLPAIYAIWVAVVAILYLPCRWFAGVKRRSNKWWMSYF